MSNRTSPCDRAFRLYWTSSGRPDLEAWHGSEQWKAERKAFAAGWQAYGRASARRVETTNARIGKATRALRRGDDPL